MSAKNDSATIRAASTGLRREVDRLDVKMKEGVGKLKHEWVYFFVYWSLEFSLIVFLQRIQMELDSRKNEVKADFKQQDIRIEVRRLAVLSRKVF